MGNAGGEMVDALRALVEAESPSADVAACNRCADVLSGLAEPLIGEPERVVAADGRAHLLWRWGGPTRVAVIGHLDTVWPLGTLGDIPFAVRDGIARGPGCFDTKAGVVQALHALAAARRLDGVALLVTADEELGSPTSRRLTEQVAAGAAAALVVEPSAGGASGDLKLARKGVSQYRLVIRGRAAHAGLEPERGANALVEAAHQVLALAAIARPELGTTVTPTMAEAGTARNVVPAGATVDVDVRVDSVEEQDRVDEALHGLAGRAVLDGVAVEVVGRPNRPPLPASSSAALYALAVELGAELGLPSFGGVAVGGGSDGNFTAGIGVPTLDGLGAVGGGAHGPDEHVHVDRMPERAALLTALVDRLLS